MKRGFIGLWLFIFILFAHVSQAQRQRYPANVNPVLGLPYSLFVSDYTDPGKDQLVANIFFNDFNESEWTFKLKIRLEGYDISMETVPGFTPAQPIVVSPGEPLRFSGSDWAPYFDYNHLRVSGPMRESLFTSGRLPEGSYTLYIQVLDYVTGDPLSPETPISWWMGLFSPPMLLQPQQEAYISPQVPQIPFSWQLFNAASPNMGLGVEYELTLWEVTEEEPHTVDPLSAVQNGQALEIFQSERLLTSSMIYGPGEPALESGKVYLYQVQAFDPEGRDNFKNEGRSEFRRFFYGWPTGGHVPLQYPLEEQSMSLGEQARVRWSTADSKLPNQPVEYEVRIAGKSESETPASALSKDLWFHYETNKSFTNGDWAIDIPTTTRTESYAWEVIGYSDGQEVARSPRQTFFGPPLLERFWAGVHRVDIISINNNPDDLTGIGKVRLTPDGQWTEVPFEHLKVEESGTFWVLKEGELLIDADISVDLMAKYEDNGVAEFRASKYRLNKEGLWVHGGVEWPLHLATYSSEQARVISKSQWFHYNEYDPVGNVELEEGNDFDLLDPFGFRLAVSPSSLIWINGDTYRLELNGYLELPEKVVATNSTGDRVKIPFQTEEQLYYFSSASLPALSAMQVSDAINVLLDSRGYTIDLSDTQSPAAFANQPDWKGLVFGTYDLTILENFDPKGRLKLSVPVVQSFTYQAGGALPAYVGSGGMYLHTTVSFDENQVFTFNTFPASLKEFTLDVQASEITEASSLAGDALIPILSESTPFAFNVPMTSQGFMSGYFTNIEGYSFIHHPDTEEQKMNITVLRAVMEEDDRVSMTLDMAWPALGIEMNAVRYFKAWGNYNVGFYTPEGLYALDQQLNTTYKGYPVTIDAITAGRNSGIYGFGVSGKITLGNDVAGNEGAPSFNMYSLVENGVLPGDYVPDIPAEEEEVVSVNIDEAISHMEAEMEAENESKVKALNDRSQQLEAELGGDIANAAVQLGTADGNAEDLIEVEESETQRVAFDAPELNQKLIRDMLIVFRDVSEEGSKLNTFTRVLLDVNLESQILAFGKMKNLPKGMSNGFIEEINTAVLVPVEREVGKIGNKVIAEVDKIALGATGEVATVVGNIVSKAANEVIDFLDAGPVVSDLVNEIAASTKAAIILEVNASINQSIYDNVTFPITTLLQDQVLGRVEDYVAITADEMVTAAFTPGADPAKVLQQRVAGVDNEIAKIGQDVLRFLKPAVIADRIKGLGGDAVTNIDPKRILGRIREGALDAVTGLAADQLVAAGAELANQLLGEELGVEIPLSVGLAAGKLLAGGSPKDLLADPIKIRHRSPAVDFNGLIFLAEDHPIYGDVFSGAIDVKIKVPDAKKPILIEAAYLNGRKDDISYWLVEVGASASQGKEIKPQTPPEGSDEIGGEMAPEMTEPGQGIKLGIAEIMAMRGRVYKHMRADPAGAMLGMVPDASNEFGAYLHLVLFGPKGGDRMRLEVEGEVNTYADGNLILDFAGNVQIDNTNPQPMTIDQTASVQGTIDVYYNKNEKHFMGYATVVLLTDGLCGEGSLLVDVKPGYWRIALGNREDRIGIVPSCIGIAYYGWIDLNKEYVEIGAGLGLAFNKQFPGFNIGVAKLAVVVDAGINVNVFASVNYKPLSLREVGIFVEMWAAVSIAYKFPLKSTKTVQLLDVYLYAEAIMRFNPPPSQIYGTLKGHVRILKIIKFEFKKDFEANV